MGGSGSKGKGDGALSPRLSFFIKRGATKKDVTSQMTMSLYVGTWNMGHSEPPEDLGGWIETGHDIYVIGLQENNFSANAAVKRRRERERSVTSATGSVSVEDAMKVQYKRERRNSDEGRRKDHSLGRRLTQHSMFHSAEEVRSRVMEILGSSYAHVTHDALREMNIDIFVHEDVKPYVKEVEHQTVATGIANVIGNKGATAVKFRVLDSDFLFINCHLAAHQEKVMDRNHDYLYICRNLRIGFKDIDPTMQFDYLFWFGDMNYRVDRERDHVIEMVKEKKLDGLLAKDQLQDQMSHQNAFPHFREQKITFPPTFKFDRKTGEYESKKKRVPSWCDRVLFRTMPGRYIEPTGYACAEHINSSDHKPVSATFKVHAKVDGVREVDPDAKLNMEDAVAQAIAEAREDEASSKDAMGNDQSSIKDSQKRVAQFLRLEVNTGPQEQEKRDQQDPRRHQRESVNIDELRRQEAEAAALESGKRAVFIEFVLKCRRSRKKRAALRWRSAAVDSGATAEWQAAQLPLLETKMSRATEAYYLEDKTVIIKLMTKANELLGVSVVSLREGFVGPVQFKNNLFLNGLVVGRIEGVFHCVPRGVAMLYDGNLPAIRTFVENEKTKRFRMVTSENVTASRTYATPMRSNVQRIRTRPRGNTANNASQSSMGRRESDASRPAFGAQSQTSLASLNSLEEVHVVDNENDI